MLNVTVENIGELAVVECEGRIVLSEAAFKLRKAVISQTDAKAVLSGLKRARSISEFYIPTMDEMMALLAYASSRHALAA